MVARYAWLLPVAVCAFVLPTARQGHAAWDYRLSAGSLTGVVRNTTSLPSGTVTTNDVYETIRGSIFLSHAGRFSQNSLSYTIGATKWLRGTQGFSLSHTLGLLSTIEASPTLTLALSGGATLTQLYMLDTFAATDPQALGPRPSGNDQLLTVYAGETLTWRPSPSWSLGEALTGRLYRRIGSSQTTGTNKGLTLDLHVSHLWTRDTAGLRGRLGAMWQGSTTGSAQPSAGQFNSQFAEVGIGWTHEWSQEWTHDFSAGVSAVRARDRTDVGPSATAGVVWRRLGKSASLRAGQSVDANVYVGSSYKRRFVNLNMQVALDRWETLRATADGGVDHMWTSATASGTEAGANAYSARLGLSWQPSPTFGFGLDYSYRDQRSSATDSTPSLFPSVRRHTAMLTIEARYPSRF